MEIRKYEVCDVHISMIKHMNIPGAHCPQYIQEFLAEYDNSTQRPFVVSEIQIFKLGLEYLSNLRDAGYILAFPNLESWIERRTRLFE
jgi:hypothetical protein